MARGHAKKRGLDLPEDVAEDLTARCSEDKMRLLQETEKLALYVGDDTATHEDVAALCPPDVQSNIFAFVDALAAGKRDRALGLLEDLISTGEPPLRLTFMIRRQFQLVARARALLDRGTPQREIASILKIPPFVARKLDEQGRKLDEEDLELRAGPDPGPRGRLEGRKQSPRRIPGRDDRPQALRGTAMTSMVKTRHARRHGRNAHTAGIESGCMRDYAADKVRAGVWSADEAEDKSAKELDGLLPEGTATRDHSLYSVRDESVPAEVGILWISPRDSGAGRSLWIYDIIVHEQFRRRGYARQILDLVEDKARELGADKVELHVFGHNHGARALYDKMGYTTTSIIMSKPVTD